jgi:hypothetical protein
MAGKWAFHRGRGRALFKGAPTAGVQPVKASPPMDVLWFRLPHCPTSGDCGRAFGAIGRGRIFIVSTTITGGGAGVSEGSTRLCVRRVDAVRKSLIEVEPHFAKHAEVDELGSNSLLSVETNRCALAQAGPAADRRLARVMSPVGGVRLITRSGCHGGGQCSDRASESRAGQEAHLAECNDSACGPPRWCKPCVIYPGGLSRASCALGDDKGPWLLRLFIGIPFIGTIPPASLPSAAPCAEVRLSGA